MVFFDRESLVRMIRESAMIDSDTHPEYVRGVAELAAVLTPLHPSENDPADAAETITRAIKMGN